MNFSDIDQFYIKAIAGLHSKEFLRTGEPHPLQKMVEEAIKAKSGKDKDLSPYVATSMKQMTEEYQTIGGRGGEEPRTASSSDNELDLDLWKDEDLMCVVCKGIVQGARNRLLECSDCQILYHQECHRPPVSQEEAGVTWTCQNCKDLKKVHKSPVVSRPSSPHSKSSKSSSSSSHKSSNGSGNYKSSSSSKNRSLKPSTSSKSSSSKQSSSSSSPSNASIPSSSSASSRCVIKPTINIVSADKRIQSMKKKAAKLHEKKKLNH